MVFTNHDGAGATVAHGGCCESAYSAAGEYAHVGGMKRWGEGCGGGRLLGEQNANDRVACADGSMTVRLLYCTIAELGTGMRSGLMAKSNS